MLVACQAVDLSERSCVLAPVRSTPQFPALALVDPYIVSSIDEGKSEVLSTADCPQQLHAQPSAVQHWYHPQRVSGSRHGSLHRSPDADTSGITMQLPIRYKPWSTVCLVM